MFIAWLKTHSVGDPPLSHGRWRQVGGSHSIDDCWRILDGIQTNGEAERLVLHKSDGSPSSVFRMTKTVVRKRKPFTLSTACPVCAGVNAHFSDCKNAVDISMVA